MSAIQQVLFGSGGAVISLPALLSISASGFSVGGQPAGAAINLTLQTNGILLVGYSANGDEREPPVPQTDQYNWIVGGTASIYSVRMLLLTGSFAPFGAAINTWLPITSNYGWGINSNSVDTLPRSDSDQVTAVLQIALTSNQDTIIESCNIDFSTQATTQSGDTNLQ